MRLVGFLTVISNLLKEEFHMTMLYGDMNLSTLMVYPKFIRSPSLIGFLETQRGMEQLIKTNIGSRRGHKLKMYLEILRSNLRSVVIPKMISLLVLNLGRRIGKCLIVTGNCIGFGKDVRMIRDCPTIVARGKEVKQVPLTVLGNDAEKKNNLYTPKARGSKSDDDDNVGNL